MIPSSEDLLGDLVAFVDLGAGTPVLVESEDRRIIRLYRDGEEMELICLADGSVYERYKGAERQHRSFRALLASTSFGNLGKWADSQVLQLQSRVSKDTMPVRGKLSETQSEIDLAALDDELAGATATTRPRTTVTLVNGPAGIGKTSLIRVLAHRRASQYRRIQRPLFLHVESRGRVLQNITDLMAFSLQTLRLGVTYDQIPALVRNGLIALAIDGFDELGDPNGYDLAWAQVNDLVTSCRGQGNIILAGRETFISKDRIEGALNAISPDQDKLSVFTLSNLNRTDAKDWLVSHGWPPRIFEDDAVAALFERDSYALRPFFLSELARDLDIVNRIELGAVEDLLSFLIEATIEREAAKFGRDIEVTTDRRQRTTFIQRLMEEVARDLAENQSDSIPADVLTWLAEVVASDIIPENLVGILKNRAGVIAFLGEDDRRSYRRFLHDQFSDYFLAHVTIRAIVAGEVPKYVRRNIFGPEFLESFSVVFGQCDESVVRSFFIQAQYQLSVLSISDRSRCNIATLILCGCSVTEPDNIIHLRDVSLDDVYLNGTVHKLRLQAVTIAQLYAREADLSSIVFEDECFINTLIADEATILPVNMPVPHTIDLPEHTLIRVSEKECWILERYSNQWRQPVEFNIDSSLKNLPLFRLLSRAARYRPFWVKNGEEKSARKILDDPHWERLRLLLIEHNLLIERHDVPASGPAAVFYHIKNRKSLLMWSNPSTDILPFFKALMDESIAELRRSG